MHRTRLASPLVAVLAIALGALAACSSDDSTPAATGGSSGSAGTGGATATGGAAGQTPDSAAGGAGGQDASTPIDASASDSATADDGGAITLTSTALTEGSMFSAENTCAGINTSPPLTWTAGPADTMSYALDLTDLTNGAVHWVIYDIPAGTTSLPAALPGDTTLTTPVSAKQIHRAAFFGAGGAYRGPCPNGMTHDYRFQVNALATATLAGVTGTSTSDDVKGLVQAASVAHGNLSGKSNARMPPADAGGQ